MLREIYMRSSFSHSWFNHQSAFLENYEYRKFFLCNYLPAGLLPVLCTNIVMSLKVFRVLSAQDVG